MLDWPGMWMDTPENASVNCPLPSLQNKKAGSWTMDPKAGPNHQQPSGLDRSLHVRTRAATRVGTAGMFRFPSRSDLPAL
jgi:hypothetical protein